MKIPKLFLTAGVLLVSVGCSDEADAENDAALIQASAGAQTVTTAMQTAPTAAASTAKRMPPGAIRVQQAKIVDAQGFGQPMTAATMLIPAGWRPQGGIGWNPQIADCGLLGTHINWMATAPDGVSQVQILPEQKFTGIRANMPMPQTQCANVIVTDPRSFFQQFILQARPNAQVLDVRPREDLKQQMQAMIPPPLPGGMGMETRQGVEAMDLLLAYQVNGQDVREIVTTGGMFFYTAIPDAMGGRMETFLTTTMPTFAYRTPNGQLDFNQAELIRKSYRQDPQWAAKMAQHRAVINRQNAQGAAARSRIISQTNSEIMDMQQDSWRRQNDMRDRGQRESTEAILGVETYNDPYNGGTVQLDNSYENAWQLNDGTFVLTNDASFEPNRYLGIDGKRLQPTP
ncbi:MAG: hypothetical protein AAGJ73_03975 [Pseudomonadota bacterium]